MRALLLFILPLLLLLIVACDDGSAVLSSQQIISTMPFSPPESAHYQMVRDEKVIGSGDLSIEKQGEQYLFKQNFDFPSEEVSNSVSALTTASIQPREVAFRVDGPEGPRTCQAIYSNGSVQIDQRTDEDERSDTLDVPSVAYDTWTDLFLWRTIDFREDYEARYSAVLSCTLARPQVIPIELKVTGRERTTVPAGAFDTWRLEIRSGGRTQKAWYATDASRSLIRYDNGDLVFELESRR